MRSLYFQRLTSLCPFANSTNSDSTYVTTEWKVLVSIFKDVATKQ